MNFIEMIRKYEVGEASLDEVIDCKRSIMRTQAQMCYAIKSVTCPEYVVDGYHIPEVQCTISIERYTDKQVVVEYDAAEHLAGESTGVLYGSPIPSPSDATLYRLVMDAVDEWLQDGLQGGKHHDLLSAELVLLEACRVRRGGTAWAS